MGAWVFEICTFLIKLYLPNKYGGSFKILHIQWLGFIKQTILRIARLWIRNRGHALLKSDRDCGLLWTQLQKKNIVWRVGNGKRIHIWKDKWIPHKSTFQAQTVPNVIDPDSTMSTLIDEGCNNWNKELIDAVFNPEEAHLIYSIPICSMNAHDHIIWGLSNKWIFSVKTAQFTNLDAKNQKASESSGDMQVLAVWNKIWNLGVVGKIKQFMWKVVFDLLPTKVNLFKKQIVANALCPCYNLVDEYVMHGLWGCNATMDVLGKSGSPVSKWSSSYEIFEELWLDFIQRLGVESLNLVAVICYMIWIRRTKMF